MEQVCEGVKRDGRMFFRFVRALDRLGGSEKLVTRFSKHLLSCPEGNQCRIGGVSFLCSSLEKLTCSVEKNGKTKSVTILKHLEHQFTNATHWKNQILKMISSCSAYYKTEYSGDH